MICIYIYIYHIYIYIIYIYVYAACLCLLHLKKRCDAVSHTQEQVISCCRCLNVCGCVRLKFEHSKAKLSRSSSKCQLHLVTKSPEPCQTQSEPHSRDLHGLFHSRAIRCQISQATLRCFKTCPLVKLYAATLSSLKDSLGRIPRLSFFETLLQPN